MTLLWLLPKGTITKRQQYASALLKRYGLSPTQVHFFQLHKYRKNAWVKSTQRKWDIPEEEFFPALEVLKQAMKVSTPATVIVNDVCCAQLLWPQIFAKAQTLKTYRGSWYTHKSYPNVNFIVVDDVAKCYMPAFSEDFNPDIETYITNQDVRKALRFHEGTTRRTYDMNYELTATAESYQEHYNFFVNEAIMVATDVETSGKNISCVGMAGVSATGEVRTITVPILSGAVDSNLVHEKIEDEMDAWRFIKAVLESPIPKTLQNGRYDFDYFCKYFVYPKNAHYDTMIMMHSFNGLMPKSLAFLASIFCDDYYFWKDEIKGDATEDAAVGYKMPKTELGMSRYYEYCGKDCYYTLCSLMAMLPQMMQTPWWLKNYLSSMELQYGAAYEMSMRGWNTDQDRLMKMKRILQTEAGDKLIKLQTAVDDDQFNPNSPTQMIKMFYDVLKTPKLGKKASSNEKILRRATYRNKFAATLLNMLIDYKRPSKLFSTLNGTKLLYDRFFSNYNAVGTWTSRFSSKKHNWWVGNNGQNMNKKIRPYCIADEGKMLVATDFSQSDGYFVAYSSEDPNYIAVMERNMNEGYDTHSHHVELMFQTPYADVIKGKKNYDPAIVHPVTGQRNIIKRVVHGTNYGMKPNTMLTTAGVEPIITASKILGFKDAEFWDDKRLMRTVAALQKKYYGYYHVLSRWGKKLLLEAHENKNLVTCYGGRTHLVLGNPLQDKGDRLARQVAAFKGQGGTAGNINRTLKLLYRNKFYGDEASRLEARKIELVAQIHDEIISQIPEKELHIVDNIVTIMQAPVTLKSRTFFVPVEPEIGYSWQVYIDYNGQDPETGGMTNDDYLVKLQQKEREYDLKLSNGEL